MPKMRPGEWWHKDASWNPVTGCSRDTGPGQLPCRARCFAEIIAASGRLREHPKYKGLTRKISAQISESGARGLRPRWTGEVRTHPAELAKPLHWRDPRIVMGPLMGDLFHHAVPDEFIAAFFGVVAACPQHMFVVPTKRTGRAVEWFEWLRDWGTLRGGRVDDMPMEQASIYLAQRDLMTGAINDALDAARFELPLPNLVLLASCEDQRAVDERVPELLRCPARWRGLLYEPALGPAEVHTDERSWLMSSDGFAATPNGPVHRDDGGVGLDWIITGHETGPGARSPEGGLDVFRSLRDQAQAAGAPFWLKKTDNRGGRELDGVEHNGVPW